MHTTGQADTDTQMAKISHLRIVINYSPGVHNHSSPEPRVSTNDGHCHNCGSRSDIRRRTHPRSRMHHTGQRDPGRN